MTHEDYMCEAIKEADLAVTEGNAPFGVVVVDNTTGEIVSRDHDRVKENCDPTAHAEINAIRTLCRDRVTSKLPDVTFYTTSEPCLTCFSAMIKAKVPQSYFGADIEEDASLTIKATEIAKQSKKHPIEVTGGILAEECIAQRKKFQLRPT
jgi:tRNA(Arg) A34 adenosine deaminase TadA